MQQAVMPVIYRIAPYNIFSIGGIPFLLTFFHPIRSSRFVAGQSPDKKTCGLLGGE